ncbi:MAG: hypothetical protein Q9188_002604 [Gyalolechia gomerana]
MNPSYQSYSPQHLPPHMQPRPQPPLNAPSFSSAPSHQDILSPASSNASLNVPRSTTRSLSSPRPVPQTPPLSSSHRLPYYPPLPWYSFTEGSFPPRNRRRRRKRPAPQSPSDPVELPPRTTPSSSSEPTLAEVSLPSAEAPKISKAVPVPSTLETPLTSHAPSETDSTQPTTPSSAVAPTIPRQQNATVSKPVHKANPPIPIVPAIPNIPLPSRAIKHSSVSITSETVGPIPPCNADHLTNAVQIAEHTDLGDVSNHPESDSTPKTTPAKIAPKSWADLVRTKPLNPTSSTRGLESSILGVNGLQHPKATSMVEALRTYHIESENNRTVFVEPRGLVNTGNMCYMNSVLQILIFCVPFYNLLEKLSRRATHNFKSETPLVDAMQVFA